MSDSVGFSGTFTEASLIMAIGERARDRGWQVELQPVVRNLRPDLVIKPSPNLTLVVEVKRESGPVHFASLSQVSAYKTAYAAVSETPALAVLATTGETDPQIDNLAADLEVFVFRLSGDDAERDAWHLVDELSGLSSVLADTDLLLPTASADSATWTLLELLARGAKRPQIAAELGLDVADLVPLYIDLLTKLEARQSPDLDSVMAAWESSLSGQAAS